MCSLRPDEVAFRLVSNPWFDRAVIATIITNCVFLALCDPTKGSDDQESFLMVGDLVFTGIFIFELLVKWLALSIPTYFKDRWNWVDFVVVLESIVSLVLEIIDTDSMDISALRALRVLRPLRAITYIHQVKLLFETVISAFVVVNTLLLCVGCLILFFGNVGYTYWAGTFSYTCITDDTTSTPEILDEDLVCGGGYTCPDGFLCGKADDFELNHGVTGYYDIWHAMLQALQVVSLDGWQQVMWHTQDAAGDYTWIYFAVLLLLGNIFLVSMFPAVISTKLEAAIQHEEERKRDRMRAEQGVGKAGVKQWKPPSEFELLLNEYSKIEADELAAIERLSAIRRGNLQEHFEDEPSPPRWTPLPGNPTMNRLRKAITLELGPFAIVVYVAIFLNALVLCLDHAESSAQTERVLAGLNEGFTSFFVLEIVIKLGLLGPFAYFTDGYNVFDFAITWLGVVEIIVEVAGAFTGLRVIRVFRIGRVLRLASLGKIARSKLNPSPQIDLARMVGLVTTCIPWIVNVYAVQLLLMYTFTVLGMQFFGGAMNDVRDLDNSIKFNYNSFGKAAVTLVDLLIGNLWNEVMFDTVEETDQQAGIVFYVLWLVLSRWLVVGMVVTVLFYRIDVDTEENLKIAARNSMRSVFALERAFMQCNKSYAFCTWRRRYEEAAGNRISTKGQMKLLEYTPPTVQPGRWKRIVASKKSLLYFEPDNYMREFCGWLTNSEASTAPSPILNDLHQEGGLNSAGGDTGSIRNGVRLDERGRGVAGTDPGRKNGLRFLPGREKLRRFVRFAFEGIMLCAVIILMVVVALDAELTSGRRTAANEAPEKHALETFAVSAFLAESAALIVARGLVLLPKAYLRDPFDFLNFLLAVLSAVCLWMFGGASWTDSTAVSAMKVARALVVFRLVKVVRFSGGLTCVLKATLSSGRAICLAGCITVFCWLQWSIIGLQVWGGTFHYCSDSAAAEENGGEDYYVYHTSEGGINGQEECEANDGFEWKNAEMNFDSFPQALHSVLIIFTFNGWQDILFSAVNARVSSEGLNAEAWHSTWAALFFLIVLMTSVVLVMLVVGVVFSMYMFLNLTKRSGRRLSSLKQAFWTMYEAKLHKVQPDTVPACPQDASPLRRLLFDVATKPRWGIAFACLIGANMVVRFLIASEWLQYSEAPTWIHVQEAFFSVLFVADWVSRVVAFGGVRAVTRSPVQVADLLATLVLVLVFIDEVSFLARPDRLTSSLWDAVQAISTIRVFRLGYTLPDIKEILHVGVKSSSVVFPLLIVLIVLTYLWSVCGVMVFGNGTYLAPLFGDGFAWEAENRHQGFFGVAQGMQTMLGVATTPGSDGWVTLMQRYEDVTPVRWRWAVVLFFSSYAVLTRYLLMNFFMMTLLFKYKMHSKDKVGVAIEQVDQFKRAWMKHAYTHTKNYHTIYAGQIVDLLKELPPPLGVGVDGSFFDSQILAKKVLSAIGIDAVAHVPAKNLTDAFSIVGQTLGRQGTRRHHLGNGPGFLKLNFSQVLVAVHRIVLFGLALENEREMEEKRSKARKNLNVLKLGVHHFLTMKAKRRVTSSSDPLESATVGECSLLRTQLPTTFMTRSTMALTAEFLRWRDEVDRRGYDTVAHQQGHCLLNAVSHEVDAAMALEQLTAKFFESHVGDRKLFTRLAEVRQHVVTLKDLRAQLNAARGDYLQTTWDGRSIVVQQKIDDEKGTGVTAMCASMDGAWVFCATENGLLKVFKRQQRAKAKTRNQRNKGQYINVQCLGVKGDRAGGARRGVLTKGLCLACSPDGFMVIAGCSDSTVRAFSQDTTGLRKAVHAMKAEGNRGRKPTVSYRAGTVGKGHRAAVTCVAWLEPGYFYTGGGDGTVRMWRKSSAKRPVQSIGLCRSMFSSGAVLCLTVWRTAYALELLAACVDIDESQDVDSPAYVLVGDGEGYLSMLPVRTDSKFFAVDVWIPSLRQQVDSGGVGVTAAEVAWGRIYTASGPSGLIKAWAPQWEDASKEKILGLVQVGQFAVHSGAVLSMVYAKGLMFSTGEDLSIVTWHPPREIIPSPAAPTAIPTHTQTLCDIQALRQRCGSGDTNASSLPTTPASGATGADSGAGARSVAVAHENEPGLVLHMAGVVQLAAVPGGLVSADRGGRLVVRGPERFTESHRVQVLPGEDDTQPLRTLAIEVLKTRGHARRPAATIAVVTGAGIVPPGAGGPSGTGVSTLVPQATLDHLCAVRFLLRAKAKRRLKEQIRAEKQTATDMNTAKMVAKKMGQSPASHTSSKAGLGASRPSRVPNLASMKFNASRRRSLVQNVSPAEANVSQNQADMTKIASMDATPAFLKTSNLERLIDRPEVYIAELMSHFFPRRDISRQHPEGFRNAPPATTSPLRDNNRGSAKLGATGGRRFGRLSYFHPAGGARVVASTASSLQSLAHRGGGLPSRVWGGGAAGGSGQHGRKGQARDEEVRGRRASPDLGALLHRACQPVPDGKIGASQTPPRGSIDDVEEGQLILRGVERLPPATIAPTSGGRGGGRAGGCGDVRASDLTAHMGGDLKGVGKDLLPRPSGGAAQGNTDAACGAINPRHPQESNHRGGPNTVTGYEQVVDDEETHSYPEDSLSTALQRKRDDITVHIPRAPEPGVWTASVQLHPTCDVAWVLAEALRMYATEHRPITQHAGLARRPQLVQRPALAWGLIRGGEEWVQTPALSASSRVHSLVRAGEELVVLVEGFNPANAFDASRRASVCAPPPLRAAVRFDDNERRSRGVDDLTESEAAVRDVLGGGPAAVGLGAGDQVERRVPGDAQPSPRLESIGMLVRVEEGLPAIPRGGGYVLAGEEITPVTQATHTESWDGGRYGKVDHHGYKNDSINGADTAGDQVRRGDDDQAPSSGDDADTLTDEEEPGHDRASDRGREHHHAGRPPPSPGLHQHLARRYRPTFARLPGQSTPSSHSSSHHQKKGEEDAVGASDEDGLARRRKEDEGSYCSGGNGVTSRTPRQTEDAVDRRRDVRPGRVSETRSPPRSVLSAMFSAWGKG